MSDERRQGMEQIREDLATLKADLRNHVDSEEKTMEDVKEILTINSESIQCIKRSIEKQKGFFAGMAFAFSFLAGVIWFLINKVFP
jgi:hypothetical protein